MLLMLVFMMMFLSFLTAWFIVIPHDREVYYLISASVHSLELDWTFSYVR